MRINVRQKAARVNEWYNMKESNYKYLTVILLTDSFNNFCQSIMTGFCFSTSLDLSSEDINAIVSLAKSNIKSFAFNTDSVSPKTLTIVSSPTVSLVTCIRALDSACNSAILEPPRPVENHILTKLFSIRK